MKKEIYAVSTFIGAVIGAGILGIPYVINRSGFIFGAINLILIGILITILNLYFGEVVLRTNGRHQLTGYASIYLGKWGKILMTITMIIGIYGALIAYLIGEGEALHSLLSPYLGGNTITYATIFFLFMSFLIFFGIKSVSRSEFYFTIIKFTILFTLVIFLFPNIKINNILTKSQSLVPFILPFGVILFAYLGIPAIPELKEILAREENKMFKVLLIGSIIPIVVYVLFSFVFVGSLGNKISEIATTNLIENKLFIIGNIFTLLVMTTPFLALGLALQEMYEYDFGFSRKKAFFFSCFIPYLIFLFGTKSFIKTITIAGAITGTLDAILIVLMFWKAKKTGKRIPEYSIKKSRVLGVAIISIFLISTLITLLFI